MRRTVFTLVLAGLSAFPATGWAQEFSDIGRPGRDGMSTIQSSMTMHVSLIDDEDPLAKQQAAIKSLYQMAGGACALVLETIADSCEIASVTSDTRVSDREARGPQLTMTSRVVMKVKFKPAAKTTP